MIGLWPITSVVRVDTSVWNTVNSTVRPWKYQGQTRAEPGGVHNVERRGDGCKKGKLKLFARDFLSQVARYNIEQMSSVAYCKSRTGSGFV